MAGTFIGDPWKLPYTAQQIQDVITNGVPVVGDNGNWWRWDINTSAWVDTGVTAATSLADDSVITSKLADGSVTTPKLADGAVTWPKLAPEARKSNDNLLDNAYFIGGGSQQGGGQFPINQRGQTEYVLSSSGYTIDRWKLGRNGKVAVQADGVLLYANTSGGTSFLEQKIENPSKLVGKELTLSFLIDVPAGVSGSIRFFNTGAITTQSSAFVSGLQLVSSTYTVKNGFEGVGFLVNNTTDAAAVKMIAAKLELGPHQTLAYQDTDENWILNDPPPKFGAELAECQRYQINCNLLNSAYARFGIGIVRSSTYAYVQVPIPVTMRGKPTALIKENIFLLFENSENYFYVPVTAISVDEISSNTVNVKCNFDADPRIKNGDICILEAVNDTDATIIFDNNL